ncbi:MAG: hypothetical protein B7C24_15970 [Bacteroidetes bacterium 4572_77]|nr:MAG: hypothetical protein B7C24_15970 [Bacteroidetes bacterium 4572_77]
MEEINKLLLDIAEKDRLYMEVITEADNSRDAAAYPLALQKYTQASEIKPNEAYPPAQIALIQALLQEQAASQNAYDAAIANGDENYNKQQWQEALTNYQEALSIKPAEVYPKDKISEINSILQQIAEKDAAYEAAITQADAFYEEENWQESLLKYQLASQIKPSEVYPQERIAELQSILGDLASAQAQYDALIQEADAYFESKTYVDSKAKYQLALQIRAQESYPTTQIQRIESILAEQAAKQQQYQALIAEADVLFQQESWQNSMDKYQEALLVFPIENYPKEQTKLITAKLSELKNKQQAYDALIVEADALLLAKDYNNSLEKYQSASAIFPEEIYPKEKMQEIRDLLAGLATQEAEYQKLIDLADEQFSAADFVPSYENYQKAVAIYADRPYPKEQIVKINSILEKQKAYQEYISSADAAFEEQQYQNALTFYMKANQLIPEETYPPQKIAEIEALLQAIADNDAAYNIAVSQGDARFDAGNYELAKGDYENARSIKPEESYAPQRIMEIDRILQDLARKQAQYDQLIIEADAAFAAKTYDIAISKYTAALDIKPAEEYPPQKMEEIRRILAQMADQKTLYNSYVLQGDQAFKAKKYEACIGLFQQAAAIYPEELYPPERIAAAQAELDKMQANLEEAYQRSINEGDRNFGNKKWDPAKEAYQYASQLKPQELYPKEKLAEINSILEKERLAKQKEYDRYIADGERFYGTKYYQEAILSFESALRIFPFEKYPADMIDKIFELIKKNSMVNILDGKVRIMHNNKEKFKFAPIPYKDRSESFILLEIKTIDAQEPVKLYVNFGKGDSQQGGYSIRLKEQKGYHSYFVNIGQQVRWINNENDYISLLPEGGDVEVKLIKISRNGI